MNKALLIVISIAILGGLWYFGSPLVLDREVNEGFPIPEIPSPEELAEMTEEELDEIRDQTLSDASQRPAKTMTERMPEASADPKKLAEGMFIDADSFHKGTGDAGIYELPDGKKIVRFENFTVTNGPDLHVLLVKNKNPEERSDIQEGFIDLGSLKGNVGSQNYEIPEGEDVSEYGSIVIYCNPFHVIFSTATLETL